MKYYYFDAQYFFQSRKYDLENINVLRVVSMATLLDRTSNFFYIFLLCLVLVFSRPQSQVHSYLLGAIFVNGSNVVLKGDTVFANDTADYGGTYDCVKISL